MDNSIIARTLKEAEEALEKATKTHNEALLTVMRLRLLMDACFLETGDKSLLSRVGNAIR